MSSPSYCWEPSASFIQKTNMMKFIHYIRDKLGIEIEDYWGLYRWSISDINLFWSHLSDYLGITWVDKPDKAYDSSSGASMMEASWFPQGTLNYAENIVANLAEERVIVSVHEALEEPRIFSREDLISQISSCREYLEKQGVGPGDRVAAVLPNTEVAVIAMLATASLGGVWSSCSPDFGVQGIVDRFGQIEPKVLFATSQYTYGGKAFDCCKQLQDLVAQLPSLVSLVTVATPDADHSFSIQGIDVITFSDLVKNPPSRELEFTPLSFDAPLFIMFSSGTTGVPKCIIHSVGGTLIQHFKELALHCDLGPSKSMLFFTTCGWMMWNWMVSCLGLKSSLVLYEGSPAYPDTYRLWKEVAKHKVNIFGTSPKYLSSCQKNDKRLSIHGDFECLDLILSTGAPLQSEQYDWIYSELGSCHVASISGGTDIISCFMLGVPILPVKKGEIQAPGLGMAVECWVNGEHKRDEKGELVCVKPFPSMPIGFWGDESKKRYKASYFEYYSHQQVWRHGDYISIGSTGGITVFGRSDATLNPGGVRIGTAEIYRVVESIDQVFR